MSLNKILTEGKIDRGLNLDVKSITTDTLTLNSKNVILDGTQLYAQQLTSQSLIDFAGLPIKFQKYNDVLHVSGIIVADVKELIASRVLDVSILLPSGYLFNTPWNAGQPFSVSGGGCSIMGTASKNIYIHVYIYVYRYI